MAELYRDYIINYQQKPIPNNLFDWDFYHMDYDGPGDNRHGFASSLDAAKQKIDDMIKEQP